MTTDPLNFAASTEPAARSSAWRIWRIWRSLAPSMAMALALAAAAAGVWAQGPWLAEGVSEGVVGHRSSGFAPALALQARCTNAMVQGTCRAMAGQATGAASTRVFVAGAGEVDAAVYEQLRRHGEAMCGEVQRVCHQAWDGTACRVARALYPEAH
jgi:hypothetical protein